MQTAALAFIKISCALFLRRIFYTGINKILDISICIYIGLTIAWALAFMVWYGIVCSTSSSTDMSVVDEALLCDGNYWKINLLLASGDLVLDTMILLFPIPLVRLLEFCSVT